VKLCHRPLNLLFALLAAMVVWLVAPAARADAPLCDMRGATAVAPNPTLDTQGGSIDATPDDCFGASATARALQRDRSPSSVDFGDQGPRASVPAKLRVRAATPTAALAHFGQACTLPSGIRHRVERPPRA
jgi:hypothetical protein